MTTREILTKKLQDEINLRTEQITKLKELDELDKIDLHATFFGDQIDFDNLKHPDIVKIVANLGGKWDKTPGDDGTIHYETTIKGMKFRCYQGEPPPNCKIVEELVTIPAVPEHIVTRKKLVCQ